MNRTKTPKRSVSKTYSERVCGWLRSELCGSANQEIRRDGEGQKRIKKSRENIDREGEMW